MKIPFVDLKSQYLRYKKEFDNAVEAVINQTAFVRGPFVKKFEADFSSAYKINHCVSCANGTDALYIALKNIEIGPEDEVITTACSWISTSEIIGQLGAKPVFVDINPQTFLININKIEDKITNKTKVIIPVHLYGQCVNMPEIMKIAKKYSLQVVEDCAQAHFASFNGKLAGSFGDIGTFSFYPGKNLGAWGDAGCIVTNNKNLATKCRRYANHGSLIKHQHTIEGINSRMDGIQAAILSVKLKYINIWTKERQKIAKLYDKLLENVSEIKTPYVHPHSKHVYHIYCIRAKNRNSLEIFLKGKGISTVRHYPTPLPFLRAYKYLNYKRKDFPEATKKQKEIISLPIFPEMTESQIIYICNSIKEYYGAV